MDDFVFILKLIFVGLWSGWFLLKIHSRRTENMSQLGKCFFTLMVVLLVLILGLQPEKSLAEKLLIKELSTGTKP